MAASGIQAEAEAVALKVALDEGGGRLTVQASRWWWHNFPRSLGRKSTKDAFKAASTLFSLSFSLDCNLPLMALDFKWQFLFVRRTEGGGRASKLHRFFRSIFSRS